MDSKTFKSEILQIVKDNKVTSPGLSDERMKQLDRNVFAHIETLFPADDGTQNTQTPTTETPPEKGPLTKIKDLFGNLFSIGPLQLAGTAIAAISLLAVGLITYQLTDRDSTLLKLPDSLTNAGLANHVEYTIHTSQRAAVADAPSETRIAFMTGVSQAALDVAEDKTDDVVRHYHQIITGDDSGNTDTAARLLSKNVDRLRNSEPGRAWMIEGYAVELVKLAATRSMTDIDTAVLADAIDFYREKSMLPTDVSTVIPEQYLEDRRVLIETTKSSLTTPSQIQTIIDSSKQMILIIR